MENSTTLKILNNDTKDASTTITAKPIEIIIIEPFYGGSHKQVRWRCLYTFDVITKLVVG
jgi:hypothetical protein